MYFEKILKKFYKPVVAKVQANLATSNEILQSDQEQQSIIEKVKLIPCNSRFIVTLEDFNIIPLFEGDEKFPFLEQQVPVEKFLKKVEESFLIPYLVYADFVHSFSKEIEKISLEQLFDMQYQICIPLKMRREDKNYSWYKQKSILLSVNGKKQMHSHINIYEYERDLLVTKGDTETTEKRFVEASILKDETVHLNFQQLLKQKRREYFIEKKVLVQRHFDLLCRPDIYDNKNDVRKEILRRLGDYMGNRFADWKVARDWLLQEGIMPPCP